MERHALKTCSKCGEVKDVSEFHRDRKSPDGRRTLCKACVEVWSAARASNPEARASTITKGTKTCSTCKCELPLGVFTLNKRQPDGYHYRCKVCDQSHKQLRNYGITQVQKDEMLAAQGGVCAICGTDSPGSTGWHTDHCHDSLKVRGILCIRCNRVIGIANEDPVILRTMAAYIEMHAVI